MTSSSLVAHRSARMLTRHSHPARFKPFSPAHKGGNIIHGKLGARLTPGAQQKDGPSSSSPSSSSPSSSSSSPSPSTDTSVSPGTISINTATDADRSTPSPSPSASLGPGTAASSPSLAVRALAGSPEWAGFLGTLANSGAVTGTLLDGIHSRMGLQVYDVAPLVLGGLRTSLLVPPLLAAFYVVLGSLHPIMDNLNPSPETDAARARCNDVGWVAASFGALAALLYTSAALYDQGVPYWQIHLVLGTAALVNWRVFDGTRQGIALALLCGVGAPAAEVVLLQLAHPWHYPRADLGDTFVSWVFWCYFFYTPALGNLARYLWATMKDMERARQALAAAPGEPPAAADGKGGPGRP